MIYGDELPILTYFNSFSRLSARSLPNAVSVDTSPNKDFWQGTPQPPVARSLAGGPPKNQSNTRKVASGFLVLLEMKPPTILWDGLTLGSLASQTGAAITPTLPLVCSPSAIAPYQ